MRNKTNTSVGACCPKGTVSSTGAGSIWTLSHSWDTSTKQGPRVSAAGCVHHNCAVSTSKIRYQPNLRIAWSPSDDPIVQDIADIRNLIICDEDSTRCRCLIETSGFERKPFVVLCREYDGTSASTAVGDIHMWIVWTVRTLIAPHKLECTLTGSNSFPATGNPHCPNILQSMACKPCSVSTQCSLKIWQFGNRSRIHAVSPVSGCVTPQNSSLSNLAYPVSSS